jgi:hypothetical protein
LTVTVINWLETWGPNSPFINLSMQCAQQLLCTLPKAQDKFIHKIGPVMILSFLSFFFYDCKRCALSYLIFSLFLELIMTYEFHIPFPFPFPFLYFTQQEEINVLGLSMDSPTNYYL